MSRAARILVPGVAHHVTARGNRRAGVFESDDDRRASLRFPETYCARHGVAVWAYRLMTNHLHLVAVLATEHALSRALRDAHTVYSLRFNARTQVSGHVWQGRFYSCPMDEEHRCTAVRYVELNPVRAGGTVRAETYPWSSAAAHCGPIHWYRAIFPPKESLRIGPRGLAPEKTRRRCARCGCTRTRGVPSAPPDLSRCWKGCWAVPWVRKSAARV